MLSSLNEVKKNTAIASTKLIRSGQVVGLGTGSTTDYMTVELGRRIREEKLVMLGVPTSNRTADLALKHGIPLTTLAEHPRLDIAIDGADQVDQKLNLIKGLGGALTREKIVDSAADVLVIIVDDSKMTQQLGVNQVVPVEVIPFGLNPVMNKLSQLGGKCSVRLSGDRNSYFITDNGNNIVDVNFGIISNPQKLEKEIKLIPGVVENGLFINMTDTVFVGGKSGVKKIDRRSKN